MCLLGTSMQWSLVLERQKIDFLVQGESVATQGPNLLPCLRELEGAGFCRGVRATSAPSGPGTQPPPSSSYLKEVSPKPLACISRVLNTLKTEGGPAHRYPLVTWEVGMG